MTTPSMTQREICRYRVIETELITGLTYCRAAFSSGDPQKRASNIAQAQRAYDGALDYTRTSKLNQEMKQNLEYKTDCLRRLLHQDQPSRVIFTLEPIRPDLLRKPKIA